MDRLLSNTDVAKVLKIPNSIIYELLEATHLTNREFDHYGLCHYALTKLGHKFGQYNGTETYDLGKLLGKRSLEGKLVEFDLVVWSLKVIPYLKIIIEKDMLDYNRLDDYYQYIGDQPCPAGRALKLTLEMRRPATMSFHQIMTALKHNHYNGFDDDDILF